MFCHSLTGIFRRVFGLRRKLSHHEQLMRDELEAEQFELCTPDMMSIDELRHWADAIADTVCVEGCGCIFCMRRPQLEEELRRRSIARAAHCWRARTVVESVMPPTQSIMQVLYPAELTQSPSQVQTADPPPPYYPPEEDARSRGSSADSYRHESFLDMDDESEYGSHGSSTSSSSAPPTSREEDDDDDEDNRPLAEVMADLRARSASQRRQGPLTTPRRGTHPPVLSGGALSGDARSPQRCGLGISGAHGDSDDMAPPEYTRFDPSRRRFPTAADILGPYPSMSALHVSSH